MTTPLRGGLTRKGGTNAAVSQIKSRPPAPGQASEGGPDPRRQRAEQFVRDCLRGFGQAEDEELIRRTAVKVLAALPPYNPVPPPMTVVIKGWCTHKERAVRADVLERFDRMRGRLKRRPWWRGLNGRWLAVLLLAAACPPGAEGYGCRVSDILDAHDRWLAQYLHWQELCNANDDFACEQARDLEEWAAKEREKLGN